MDASLCSSVLDNRITGSAIRNWVGEPEPRGGVDLQVVPIDHEEMLREPHVQILAKRLRERLLDYYAAREKEKSARSVSYAAVGSESEVS